MNTIKKEEKVRKGNEAEYHFKKWLDKHKIPYLYIQQDTETFSSAFKSLFSAKRPDFMILVPNFGFMFVDVKYRKINPEYKSYPLDSKETKVYSSLQRRFNLQIWYAISNEELGYNTWLWIPVAKVLESGITEKISSKSRMDFLPIPSKDFIQIADSDSLDRLLSKCF